MEKKEVKIDNYQLKAIESRNNSVVSAGAGSGKTTVLSQRFLSLLKEHKDWNVDNILTLTFTKKATVEMSSRIYQTLKTDLPEQAALFYKSNIKTLDSYCNSVAKLGCHYYGISPDFVQDKNALYSQVQSKALPFILKHRDNEVIKLFVSTLNYETIANELFVSPIMEYSTIAKPIDFTATFKKQHEHIIAKWDELNNLFINTVHSINSFYKSFSGSKTTQFYKSLIDFSNLSTPDTFSLTMEQIWNAEYTPIVNYINEITPFFSVKSPRNGKGTETFPELLNKLKAILPVYNSIANYIYGFSFCKSVLPLLEEFQNIVMDIKRTTGILSFADISEMALDILTNYPEIRLLEKQKYKAIMIDEFQDNNQMQRDMLFLLAEKEDRMEKSIPESSELEPDKLFFVGDEKQSIYRFRGADVSVFRQLRDDFKEGNLEMSNNYRSSHALIGAFNTIFGGIKYPLSDKPDNTPLPSVFYNEQMAEHSEVPNYEPVYTEVTLPQHKQDELTFKEAIKELYKPDVHLAFYQSGTEAEKNQLTFEQAEAEWVALEIEKLHEQGTKYSDIAILMQKYNFQPLFERTFLRHGIPYNTEAITGFFADGPVNDIVAYLRMTVYEKETTSYAQVLRSPFVNLSILETNAILNKELPFFDEKAADELCEESKKRYLHAKEFYDNFVKEEAQNTIAQNITKLWYDSGYRFETMWNNTVEMYSKLYDLLFELGRKADEQSLNMSAFVDSVINYKGDSTKIEDMDIPLEQTSGVHILSIHKSKGLEYEVVFVCNTHSGMANNSESNKSSTPVYYNKNYGLTLNTPSCPDLSDTGNYFYLLIKDLQTKMKNAEMRRLSYVALTRAKKKLYITSGKWKPDPKAGDKFSAGKNGSINNIYSTIAPAVEFYTKEENLPASPFTPVEFIPAYDRNASGITRNTQSAKITYIQNLLSEKPYETAEIIEKEIIESPYLTPSHLHESDDEERDHVFTEEDYKSLPGTPYPEINNIVIQSIPKKGEEPKFGFNNFGTIAHAFMEAAIKQKNPEISNKDLAGLDGNKEKKELIFKICTEMAENFKKTKLGKAAINSVWHKPEYPFRNLSNGKIIKGIIDLVFENADGTYIIVDYKTNQTMKPEIYYEQLACYKQAVAQMLNIPEEKISCYLYYLRFGKEVKL